MTPVALLPPGAARAFHRRIGKRYVERFELITTLVTDSAGKTYRAQPA
jgi:hypothetical protein